MPNDPVQIVHEDGRTATIQRSALGPHERRGWKLADGSQVEPSPEPEPEPEPDPDLTPDLDTLTAEREALASRVVDAGFSRKEADAMSLDDMRDVLGD